MVAIRGTHLITRLGGVPLPHQSVIQCTKGKVHLPMRVRQSSLIHTPYHNSQSHIISIASTSPSHPQQSIKFIQQQTTLVFLLFCIVRQMASINSSVLACSYAISGAGAVELSSKSASVMCAAPPSMGGHKLPVIKAQQQQPKEASEGRRVALVGLAAALVAAAAASTSSADAGIIEEYLEKSKANKELNDKKRLATSGANFARAYTVEFGTCKFPENFTGCQDLAKQKKVPFLSDDLALECEGKDKYKCGSNVFWKW